MIPSADYLETFLLLAESLSFSETARRLKVTQPCVSRHIKLLEESLGTRLFIRDRSRVLLTERARELRASLGPHLREIRQILTSVKSGTSTELSGRVSFGCLAEVGQYAFMPVLLEFQRKHPAVTLAVEYLKEFEIIAKVKAGELDLGVVTSPSSLESLRAFELMSERVVLVTRTKNAQDPLKLARDTGKIPVVTYRQDDPLFGKFMKTHGKALGSPEWEIRVSVNSHRSMLDATLSGDVFAVMPFHSVRDLVEKGRLRIVPGHELRNELYLILLENPLMERRLVAFRRFLMDQLQGKKVAAK